MYTARVKCHFWCMEMHGFEHSQLSALGNGALAKGKNYSNFACVITLPIAHGIISKVAYTI